jgi:hypothetical protein
MFLPEVHAKLNEHRIQSVVLFGIEVCYFWRFWLGGTVHRFIDIYIVEPRLCTADCDRSASKRIQCPHSGRRSFEL